MNEDVVAPEKSSPPPSDGNIPLPKGERSRAWFHPLVTFLHTEAASGLVLLVCTVVALNLANSPWSHAYHAFWNTHLAVTVGVPWLDLDKPLEWWVNDALMVLFFFVVGLEIKRELVAGELRDPRKAALPAAAALGGMIVPALIYLSLPGGRVGERGWGIPMATDIAFVVGFLALLGRRVPAGLKILLLSLAIVDDLGAVLVIAIAYTDALNWVAFAVAGAGLAGILALRFSGVRRFAPYVLLGIVVWRAVYASGVHPTIAGVILGFLTPTRESLGKSNLLAIAQTVVRRLERDDDAEDDLEGHGHQVHELADTARATLSPLARLESALHPWVAFGIMPLFALANAGVEIRTEMIHHPVAYSVALGLFLGKPIGIFLFSFLAILLRLARLPSGVTPLVLLGGGCLAGIGFTMSLFVTGLAFDDPHLTSAGKVGTLAGSLGSAIVGCGLLLLFLRKPARTA